MEVRSNVSGIISLLISYGSPGLELMSPGMEADTLTQGTSSSFVYVFNIKFKLNGTG